MWPVEPDYLTPYREAQQRHGSAFEVTLWASPRSQVKRFEVVTQMVYLPGKSVVDIGCSRGDFAAYLHDAGLAVSQYVGLDALPGVTAYATARNLPRCRFVTGDALADPGLIARAAPGVQVAVISGTLNTMTLEQALTLLDAAWAAVSQALVFNFLPDTADARAPLQDDFARRLDTLALLRWAMKKTWHVQFRQDYFQFGHDATLALRKPS